MDNGLKNFLNLINNFKGYINIGLMGFYGYLIGFSIFALLGMCLIVCFNKSGCRYLMYFSCMFLFLAAFIGFIVSIIFSVIVPVFSWTCSFLSIAVSSNSGFQSIFYLNLGNFGAFLSNSTVNQIKVCMPFGDGNIINTVGGNGANGLNNLTNVITSLKTFNNVTL